MIYLIITSSIENNYGIRDVAHREKTYKESIEQSLSVLPKSIKPIIVENNGQRQTFLDDFGVDVVYTENNFKQFPNKGGNELADIKHVINAYDMKDDDIVIKLTGRYKLISDMFLQGVIHEQEVYDAFVKFFNVCTLEFMPGKDCVLGLYAIRVKYLKNFEFTFNGIQSIESEFAMYASSLPRCKACTTIDLECCFAEDHRTLRV
jgi:hypothetical protein